MSVHIEQKAWLNVAYALADSGAITLLSTKKYATGELANTAKESSLF
jgi:hypothetical protein